jgi:hypothetical protein
VLNTRSAINAKGKYNFRFLLIPSLPPRRPTPDYYTHRRFE